MGQVTITNPVTNHSPASEVDAQCRKWRDAGQITVCTARVWWSRNYRTHEITITGSMCCALDQHTILLYPIHVYRFGYFNKTNTRKLMSEVKRELVAKIKEQGYRLTEPIEMKSLEYF